MKSKIVFLALTATASLYSFSASASTLVQVYQQAIKSDPTFAQDQASWQKAKAQMTIASAGVLPNVDINGGAGRNYSNTNKTSATPTGKDYFNQFTLGASITQPIFNVQNWDLIAQASDGVKAATATYSGAAQSLMQRVTSAYFQILEDSSTVKYDEAENKTLLRQLETARQEYKVGLKAITSVYQVQSQYNGQVAQTIADRTQLQTDIEALSQITGQRYSVLKGPAKPLKLSTPNPQDINAWVKTAEKQNYSLSAARYTMLSYKDAVEAAAAGRYPTLSLQLNGSHIKANGTGKYTNVNTGNLTLAGDFNVFQGGAVTGNTDSAEADYANYSAKYVAAHRSTITNTRNAYLNIISLISKIKADRVTITYDKKSLESIRAGYQVGTQTMFEVLNAISTLYKDQKTYWTDQYAYLNALISLKIAAGTLSANDIGQINGYFNKNFYLSAQTNSREAYHKTRSVYHHKAVSKKPAAKKAKVTHQQAMANSYAIQFFAGSTHKDAANFVKQLPDEESYKVVKVMQNGHPLYRVVTGQYKTHAKAKQALDTLPADLKKFAPWIVKI